MQHEKHDVSYKEFFYFFSRIRFHKKVLLNKFYRYCTNSIGRIHISCGDLSYCAGRFHNIYILVLDGQDSQLLCRFHFYPKEKLVTCHSSKFHLIKNILFNGYARFFLFLLKNIFLRPVFTL